MAFEAAWAACAKPRAKVATALDDADKLLAVERRSVAAAGEAASKRFAARRTRDANADDEARNGLFVLFRSDAAELDDACAVT